LRRVLETLGIGRQAKPTMSWDAYCRQHAEQLGGRQEPGEPVESTSQDTTP
jgi:hypothetical protein